MRRDYDYPDRYNDSPRGGKSYDSRYYDSRDRYHERYIRDENYADNRYEYKGGRKVKKEKEPRDLTLNVIKFFKLSSQVLYIVAITFMVLGLAAMYILFKTKEPVLYNNYVGDASLVLITLGSALGVLGAIFFFVLFIMLFFNRKGWLRKSKSYIPGLLSFASLFVMSSYILLISQFAQSEFEKVVFGQQLVHYEDLATIFNDYIFKYFPSFGFLPQSELMKFWNNLDTHLWISVVILAVVGFVGSLYVKSLGKTLDESEHYFSRRRYR